MKLDEALQHRWAGKDIRRRCWKPDQYLNSSKGYGTLTLESVDADDWEVVPKRVGLSEAWKHMKIGNRVVKDGRIYSFDTQRPALCVWKHEGGNVSAGWYRLNEGIPIDWIDATDFELVEDK